MSDDTIILIPIRMSSSRFPGKPLIDINGKPMIWHVWNRAKRANCGKVVVACCDNIVKKYLIKEKIPFVMTNKKLNSGTDRVFEALEKASKKKKYKYVINIQGDLPNIEPSSIKKLSSIIKTKKINMATLVSKIIDRKKVEDENIVKVVLTKKDKLFKAIYFSRSPIPFNANLYYEHIGVYAYKIKTLKKFTSFKISELEKVESLEQLRAIDNGLEVFVDKINKVPMSIDTPNDLKSFLKFNRRLI